jgi:hypothetical protein
MFRGFRSAIDLEAAARAMRDLHARWLTRALQHGRRPPRIPVRKVSEGGWAALMATPEGKAWAEEFWQGAFEHPDTD